MSVSFPLPSSPHCDPRMMVVIVLFSSVGFGWHRGEGGNTGSLVRRPHAMVRRSHKNNEGKSRQMRHLQVVIIATDPAIGIWPHLFLFWHWKIT